MLEVQTAAHKGSMKIEIPEFSGRYPRFRFLRCRYGEPSGLPAFRRQAWHRAHSKTNSGKPVAACLRSRARAAVTRRAPSALESARLSEDARPERESLPPRGLRRRLQLRSLPYA